MKTQLKELSKVFVKFVLISVVLLITGQAFVEFVVKPWADSLPEHPSERQEVKEYRPLVRQ